MSAAHPSNEPVTAALLFTQSFLATTPDLIYIYDLIEQRNVYANREVSAMLGYTPEQIADFGSELFVQLMHPNDMAGVAKNMQLFAHLPNGEVVETEYRMRHANGTWRWLHSREVICARLPDGTPQQVFGIAQDITRHQETLLTIQTQRAALEVANAQLARLAITDGLTGIYNRRALNEQLEHEFLLAQRHTLPLSVLLLDVDHFKVYNDNFGHLAGDSVLQHLAKAIGGCIRETDFFARYGGEEFCILLPQTDEDGALRLAERIHAAVATPNDLHQPVTVSIGGATFAPTMSSSSQLLAQADRMLYLAKRAGRNSTRHARESSRMLNQR